jgi:hypothetical protein
MQYWFYAPFYRDVGSGQTVYQQTHCCFAQSFKGLGYGGQAGFSGGSYIVKTADFYFFTDQSGFARPAKYGVKP